MRVMKRVSLNACNITRCMKRVSCNACLVTPDIARVSKNVSCNLHLASCYKAYLATRVIKRVSCIAFHGTRVLQRVSLNACLVTRFIMWHIIRFLIMTKLNFYINVFYYRCFWSHNSLIRYFFVCSMKMSPRRHWLYSSLTFCIPGLSVS